MERTEERCGRPECEGFYEDVGGGELYCGDCGLAPVVSPQGLVTSQPTELTARSGSGAGTDATHPVGAPGPPAPRTAEPRSGIAATSSSGRGSGGALGAAASGPGSGAAARGRLGAGLVSLPQVPRPDPQTAVLADPEVPERRRFCSRGDCGAPVGRSRDGSKGRTEGFCTHCGQAYSFVPKLRAGDVVHDQYEVAGCLAHGGFGWIYLATDRKVADRWVVLKGLLDTGDEDALAVSASERRHLAEIEHANIVRIYNYVEHAHHATGNRDEYIVMEYVGGKSLKDIANASRTPDGRRIPLPVEQACAYGIEALEALGHLHSRGLLYCDFKLDNAIQQHDQLKLIDLGAVCRMDDNDGVYYGTVGYQAPEIAASGPSVASDLYTVARALAVLTFDFQGYTSVFADTLPDPANIEVFRTYESFYRLLVRATDPDRERRFSSAAEMAEQLTGVLREVVALQDGVQRPALSTVFGGELRATETELLRAPKGPGSRLGAREVAPAGGFARLTARRGRTAVAAGRAAIPAQQRHPAGTAPGTAAATDPPGGGTLRPLDTAAVVLALPAPRVDPADANAGFLAGLMTTAPAELLTALRSAPADSLAIRLREVRAHLELAAPDAAHTALADVADAYGGAWAADWRVRWHRGLVALTTGDHPTAVDCFHAAYDAFPGEPAPKLALAVCAELLERFDDAAAYYHMVWTTDHRFVSAAFGLARVRLLSGERAAAVEVLESVPESSIHYTAARIAALRARLWQRSPKEALLDDLRAAAEQTARLKDFGLDAERREQLSTEVWGCALDWVLSGSHGARPDGGQDPSQRPSLLGRAVDERSLRIGLEEAYRQLARLARRGEERIELVERANRFRPRTWV